MRAMMEPSTKNKTERSNKTNLNDLRDRAWSFRESIVADWADLGGGARNTGPSGTLTRPVVSIFAS